MKYFEKTFRLSPAIIVVCFFLTCSPAHAAVAVVASSTAGCEGTVNCTAGDTTLTFPADVNGASNFLLVAIATQGFAGTPLISSVMYNGVALTFGTTSLKSFDTRVGMWYMATSSVGTKNVVITAAGAEAMIMSVATAFSGVNASTPIRGFASNDSPGSGTASVSISSATNDLVVDMVCDGTSVDSSSQTAYAGMTGNSGHSCYNVGASTQAGAASVTMTWAVGSGSGDTWSQVAASLEPTSTAVRYIRLRGGVRLLGGIRLL